MRSFRISALASFLAAANAMPTSSADSQLAKREDAVCDNRMSTLVPCGNSNCYQFYVEKRVTSMIGAGVTVSPDINCDTAGGCTTQISSFIDNGVEQGAFKGGVSAGASWDWGMSSADSLAQSFMLNEGESGHIVFFPYLHQSCGALNVQNAVCDGGAPPKAKRQSCSNTGDFVVNDPNSCGTTPILVLNGGQRLANGCVQFCHTGAMSNGLGCSADPAKCVPPQ